MGSHTRTSFPVLGLFLIAWVPASAEARDLPIAQRIEAQTSIERVRYAHQLETTQPFEQAVPRAVIDRRVDDALKQTVALELFWKTPVTAEMLRRERERIEAG